MAEKKSILYAMVIDPYGKDPVVRVKYSDGTTKDIRKGEKGYASMRRRAMKRGW
jgi:hypothetical protein